MSTLSTNQEAELKIIEILKLLEETFHSKDTKKIKEARNKLNEILKDLNNSIELLFLALSSKSIQGKEITLDLHKSVALYLKNLFYAQKGINSEDAYNYLIKIFDLIFNKSEINPHLTNVAIFTSFQAMISSLLSNQRVIEAKDKYISQLFNLLLTSIKNVTNEKFLSISKSVVLLSTSLFSSKCAVADNYIQLINEYYIPIINIVFSKVGIFLIPKSNIYNNEYIIILKLLLDGFYSCLSRMRSFFPNEKRKEIALKLFKDYGIYCLELIQLSPAFDENTKKQYGDPNPILVFNPDEKLCYELNNLKSKAIQFLSFITQISTLEDRLLEEDEKNVISDNELIDVLNKLISLIISCFEDILKSENKFNLIRKYNGDINEEEDRLNILFPMIVTIDDENAFADTDPDGYHQYINDIVSEFKNKNFRTSACFLVKKICDKYEDMSNFMISFCLEMLDFIMKNGQVNEEFKDINIYLKNKDALINQFNDKKKLDFALLIILILRDRVKNSPYLKNRLIEILVNNSEKIHLILSPIIKIKLCKIYNYFIPKFFENNDLIKEEAKKLFIENVVNYLLNNIIQKNLPTGEEYSQALSYGASDTIIELLNLPKESDNADNALLNKYVTINLEKNFGIINQLIQNVDIYTFFLVVDHILGSIKITQRDLVFESINNLSKKFLTIFLSPNNENKLFLNQYFTIISSFLLGVNKLTPENKEEIAKFNEYFKPIIVYIKNPKKFLLYEHLVSTTEEYIKCIDGINEESALVLKNIKLIVEKDDTLSLICFSYVSTFLNYIQKSVSNTPLNQQELFNDILDIIKKAFSIKDETLETSKSNALLLTFQILNLNPNLSPEIFEYLIFKSLDSFELAEVNDDVVNDRDSINQLSLANVSLGFIFKPEQTYKIQKKKIVGMRNEQQYEIPRFTRYITLIKEILEIPYSGAYCPTLGKCIILGICAIFSNQFCREQIKQLKDLKFFVITIFINLVLFHKKQKNTILNKLMKKETNCNFVNENGNSEEDEEEEEDDYDEDEEFNADIEKALKGNDNIKNSDEFKFFSDFIKNLKENDKDLYNFFVNRIEGKVIEELSLVRNIQIKYKDKEFTVPRKTVKIIRKQK